MSLSKKGSQTNNIKLNFTSKVTNLNPNAAEFIPLALRSSSSSLSGSSSNVVDATVRFPNSGTIGKTVLDRSESSISNASDEEALQFWRHQLPDDITPDFKVMSEDESQGFLGIPFAGLSLHDNGVTRSPASAGSNYALTEQQEPSLRHINGSSFSEKMRYSSSLVEDPVSANFLNLPTNVWDKQIVDGELLGNFRELNPYNENARKSLISDMIGEPAIVDDTDLNPVEILASQFPGFATESLAEVYFANGCDLNLTIEMLTQLELQVDGGNKENVNTKALSAPNLSAIDFPALTLQDGQNALSNYVGDDHQQSGSPYHSTDKDNMLLFKSGASFPSRGAVDFAAAVRKLASHDSGMWKHDRNGSSASTVGSSRNSHVLASTYNGGHGRSIYADRLQNHGSARAAPVWLETGEAVAKMYSEVREEARDHARLRNAYFEQASEAYLIGNKALAKELSLKGQLHSMHMKAAHGKAQESIYRQRNPVGQVMQGNGKGHERMIDLHGLHVTEAIHLLKHELTVIRSAARASDQRLQVYICVGTGHHTRGSRTPARLPVAVQRYLLEEEGIDYTEPQPGLLRVVIY